jgi:hypothetical protein
MDINVRYGLDSASEDGRVPHALFEWQRGDMQAARYSKLVQDLWSETGVLESIVGKSQSNDICYWIIGQLVIFVYNEFSPVRILLGKPSS